LPCGKHTQQRAGIKGQVSNPFAAQSCPHRGRKDRSQDRARGLRHAQQLIVGHRRQCAQQRTRSQRHHHLFHVRRLPCLYRFTYRPCIEARRPALVRYSIQPLDHLAPHLAHRASIVHQDPADRISIWAELSPPQLDGLFPGHLTSFRFLQRGRACATRHIKGMKARFAPHPKGRSWYGINGFLWCLSPIERRAGRFCSRAHKCVWNLLPA